MRFDTVWIVTNFHKFPVTARAGFPKPCDLAQIRQFAKQFEKANTWARIVGVLIDDKNGAGTIDVAVVGNDEVNSPEEIWLNQDFVGEESGNPFGISVSRYPMPNDTQSDSFCLMRHLLQVSGNMVGMQ